MATAISSHAANLECKGNSCSMTQQSCDVSKAPDSTSTKTNDQYHKSSTISWNQYNPDLFKLAQEKNRLLLLYIRSANCEWSKKMEESFNNAFISGYINEHFIPVIVDFNNNRDVAISYKTIQLPTIIILNADNKPVRTLTGYVGKSELIKDLHEIAK